MTTFDLTAPRVRPTARSPRGSFIATVKENRSLCTDHYRLILSVADFPASVPGQFVQLDCRPPGIGDSELVPLEMSWPPARVGGSGRGLDPDYVQPLAYLRRPFSIADHRVASDNQAEIDVIHRVVGKGTRALEQLRRGMTISLLGPLGVGFSVPEGLELACLVGGGVGIPPMFYLARYLAQQGHRAVGFVGAQRHDLLPLRFVPDAPKSSAEGDAIHNVEEFQCLGYPSIITTDDGSCGMKGFITQALTRFLKTVERPEKTEVYCCGPTPMMKATAQVAASFNVRCQLSLEQPMACGMGTCQSCIIRYRPHTAPADTEWKYKLTCTDGPVFDARDIIW